MAEALIHSGTITGKLKGVMQPTTPTGALIVCTSTPPATPTECSPLSRCTRPAANSTFSMPRLISPLASLSTLPCSRVMIAARSSWRSTSNWRMRKNTSARRTSPVAAHFFWAAAATAMAWLTSSVVANATRAASWPVAGLKIAPVRSPLATSLAELRSAYVVHQHAMIPLFLFLTSDKPCGGSRARSRRCASPPRAGRRSRAQSRSPAGPGQETQLSRRRSAPRTTRRPRCLGRCPARTPIRQPRAPASCPARPRHHWNTARPAFMSRSRA